MSKDKIEEVIVFDKANQGLVKFIKFLKNTFNLIIDKFTNKKLELGEGNKTLNAFKLTPEEIEERKASFYERLIEF